MFELQTYRCPDCGAEIREKLTDGQQFDCPGCHRAYRVLLDTSSPRAGFVPIDSRAAQEPLGLPRGSVRAVATLATAGSAWILILAEQPVPGYVLSLLLTIIGYYFGFRQKLRGAESRILDASARIQEPLYLPGGSIRLLLIVGFAACGVLLAARRQMTDPVYLEFFIILAGLVGGYFFARLFAVNLATPVAGFVNHLKGAVVLGATIALAALLLIGLYPDRAHLGLGLACAISFYFGSRS
ncbi:MAG: zinc ribbon domain-containing protein [Sedimentisphaerales bacterium]|nr:zinc ribbon domain-containing protein [Sedimentisphaerales bacterium]